MAQTDTIAFLTGLLGAGDESVETIETHISIVLMGGNRVYKLKRDVALPYVDFSTPALRLAACEAELALNRRTAPTLYVATHRITRGPDGSTRLDGDGELIDALVEMRRFDQGDLFDAMARDRRLTAPMLTDLARLIAAFHQKLPAQMVDGPDAIRHALDANARGFAACGYFDRTRTSALIARFEAVFERLRPLLASRARNGAVRRCHGDLHLRNICLFDGKPTLFDCIEFDDRLATIDVLYDLAFLLMDLWRRGLREEANLVFNRYLDETGDTDELAIMPFFMAVRAAVRAHVDAAQIAATGSHALDREANACLELAEKLLAFDQPGLVAVGGLSGTGKSTLAARIAPCLGAPPGARILSTDRIRKKLHGVSAETRLPESAYSAGSSARVYEAQRDEAKRVLLGAHSVVADGVFLREAEREAIEAIANDALAPFRGLWLEAPVASLTNRIAARKGDPSDATVDVLRFQHTQSPGRIRWTIIDAGAGPDATVAAARHALNL